MRENRRVHGFQNLRIVHVYHPWEIDTLRKACVMV
jgi:hypothetical protein